MIHVDHVDIGLRQTKIAHVQYTAHDNDITIQRSYNDSSQTKKNAP